MPLTHILVDFENTQPSADDVALLRGKDQRLWIFRGPGQRKYDAEFAEALMALGERVRVVRCEKSGRNALDMHIAFQIGRLFGEMVEKEGAAPELSFVVVSRDTDYEPLLQYVRAQGYAARRAINVRAALESEPAEKAPATKAAKSKRAAATPAAKTRAPAATKAAKKTPAAAKAAKAPAKTAKTAKSAGRATESRAAAPAESAIDQLVEKVILKLRDHPRNRPTRRDRLDSWLASHLRGKLAGASDVGAIVGSLEKRGLVTFAGNKVEYPQWS